MTAQRHNDLEKYFSKLINQHKGLNSGEIRVAFDNAMNKRVPRIDLSLKLNALPEKIATIPSQIKPGTTEIYCGDIVRYDKNWDILPGYIDLLPKLVNMGIKIFASPKEEVEIIEVETEGNDGEQLIQGIKDNGGNLSDWANKMIAHKDFQITPKGIIMKAVVLRVKWLNLKNNKTQNIWKVSEIMGLRNCPSDFALILGSSKKHLEWLIIKCLGFKMKRISVSNGYPNIFILDRHVGGLWLDNHWAHSDDRWASDHEFVFLLPPDEKEA